MTEIDFSSLTPEQHETFMASPMSKTELDHLAVLEQQLTQAFKQELKAELEIGKGLAWIKEHPKRLWQRSAMFRTKTGGWKKRRSWDAYVLAHNLAESGKEADRLIAQWKQREMFREIDN